MIFKSLNYLGGKICPSAQYVHSELPPLSNSASPTGKIEVYFFLAVGDNSGTSKLCFMYLISV